MLKTFRGGIHPPEKKEITEKLPSLPISPGDEVIISPFLSSRDLRLENTVTQPAAAESPRELPEIEAVLTPVP